MLALITGASSGIGRELAKLYAADSYDIVLVARRLELLNALATELQAIQPIQVHTIAADLGQHQAGKLLVSDLESRGIQVDALVNNAGFGLLGPFSEADQAKMLEMVQLNVTTLVELTGLLLPGMVQRGHGHVLNVASTAAFQPGPLMAVYYATKAFVLSFSEAIAEELRGSGVTVTALCPGPTRTGFGEVAGMQKTGLFDGPNVLDTASVAQAGYRAAQRGQFSVVPGFLNRLLVFSVRLMPRWLIRKLIKQVQSGRSG